jgi:Uri superfamily endonuclease
MVRKGAYILIIRLEKGITIKVGRLGKFNLMAGYYAYVGSALNSLDGRLKRYFGKSRRKKHWHIDYLSEKAKPVSVFYYESTRRLECRIASVIGQKYPIAIKGFGSSDCNCPTHLFYLGKKLQRELVRGKFKLDNLEFTKWSSNR